jgi:predicted RNA methylase
VPDARGSLRSRVDLINAYISSMTSRYANDEVTVNPAWGLTKTGAPRKRLPQACLSVYTIAHDSLLD